ncbi:MAG: chemotaxis protein CheA [Caldilineaceae bacterium]|nr:chemotaxis protein CheA [Caldilineaceae bacterium]HRJ40981.1 chemotaxis protein CheA [Caldilineaceae bacterium]
MKNYDLTSDEAGVFFEEANELLESLDRDLVTIEQEATDELIHRIFRSIHTLKGAAGSIGHDPMALLAHAAETLLEKVRNHEIGVSTQMANLLFRVVGNLRIFLTDVAEDRPASAQVEEVIEHLGRMLITDDPIPDQALPQLPLLSDSEYAAVEEGLQSGLSLMVIYAEADSTGIAPLARLLQMYMHIEQIGQIVVSTPSSDELERGEGAKTLVTVALTDLQNAEIEAELSSIFEISVLRIADLSNVSHLLMPVSQAKGKGEEDEADQSRLFAKATKPYPRPRSDDTDRPMKGAAKQMGASSRTIRTSVERLDSLMNLAGELVTDRNRLFQIYEDLSHLLNDEQLAVLNDTVTHLSAVTDRIHDEVFKARMQPIEYVFNKFPRFVRQICQEVGKEVELRVTGQETEVDRTVIEQIGDPILHLVRNAIDHGIETVADRLAAGKEARGQLALSARSEEGNIIVSISDDGKGVDAEKVKRKAISLRLITEEQASSLTYHEAIDLIFAPGLSTAIKISDLSGRGVGMDVVRNNIQRLNGSVVVYSTPGVGTTFELQLPLTLAIIPALLVEVCQQVFALPLPNVVEIFKLDPENVHYVRGRETTYVRGEVLPLVRLEHLFAWEIGAAQSQAEATPVTKTERGVNQQEAGYVVSVSYREIRLGVIVSALLGKQDVVIKPLGYPINNVRGLTGATLLGDGRIGLIADIAALVSLSLELKALVSQTERVGSSFATRPVGQ